MMGLLRAVTQFGTGAAAAQLNHPVGGKTGTTSDYTDAWFLGFSPSITCGVWVGFDSRESLGDKETGARAALPIWMTWMRAAIVGKDDEHFLGDEKKTPAIKTAVAAPAKPAADKSAAKPLAKQTSPSAPAKPAVANSAAKPLVKPALPSAPAKSIAASPSAKAQVKPALPPPPAPKKL
jgi:penicillin-binding protein 1A